MPRSRAGTGARLAAAALAVVLAASCSPGLPLPGLGSRPSPTSPAAGDLAPRAISQHSPIASCGGSDQLVDAPEEPSLAVDPADARHLVAAWQQDRRPGGAAYGIAVAVSRDAGATWRESMLPGLARCAGGGPYALVSDTWVSIGPDHAAYAGALALTDGRPRTYAITVSASRDGGGSWESPVVVAQAVGTGEVLDKPSILADPRVAGRVYAVWARFRGDGDEVTFARSDDHGRTWSTPAGVEDPGAEAQNNELVAPSAGVLLDVLADGRPLDEGRPARVAVLRSTDGGRTWSAPVPVATFTLTHAADPERGAPIRATGQDVVAAAGGGWAYAAWFEVHRDGPSTVWVSGSGDGGRTWSAPAVVVSGPAPVFLPTLAVAGDGRPGVTWYDLRSASGGGPGLATEVWAATSADHGVTWRSRRLDGPFDLRAAPVATSEGSFVGDYEGLVGLPSAFAAAYVRTTAAGTANRTEIAFARFR